MIDILERQKAIFRWLSVFFCVNQLYIETKL